MVTERSSMADRQQERWFNSR